MKLIGRLDKVLLTKVGLLPLERYCLFHIANLLLNLSSTISHTLEDLNKAPKGRP